jgi:hypothetical protein
MSMAFIKQQSYIIKRRYKLAISVRKNSEEAIIALAYALNAQQSDFTDGYTDGYFHRDVTQTTNGPLTDVSNVVLTTVTVTAAAATSLSTSLTLVNQLFGIFNLHMSDGQVHLRQDVVNLYILDGYQTQAAVDLPSAIVLVNALKVLFNDHLVQSGIHQINDTVNTVNTANASTQTTVNNLANQLKTSLNAHMASCPTGAPRIRFILD